MKKIEIKSKRQDKVLNVVSSETKEISYSLANALLRKKDIKVNGTKIKENITVYAGDEISIFVSEDKLFAPTNYKIIFEDNNIIIIDKGKGIEVCDGTFNVVSELKKQNKIVFAVHRLDRNTDGLVILAKSKEVLGILTKAIKKHEIKKYYLAEVVGCPKKDNFEATAFLVKDEEKSEVRIFDKPLKNGEKINTTISVLKRTSGTSLLEIELASGKTHQIRAHLAHLGYPIIGDGKYGNYEDNKKYKEKTQKLTAYKIVFELTDKNLEYLNDKKFQIKPKFAFEKDEF